MRFANVRSEKSWRDILADVARPAAGKKPRKTLLRERLGEARDEGAKNGEPLKRRAMSRGTSARVSCLIDASGLSLARSCAIKCSCRPRRFQVALRRR